jgi:antitoxin CptB
MKEIDLFRKRLYYQSQHRGMKEMDLILGGFAQQHLQTLTEEELLEFEQLLALSDQQLYGWIVENDSVTSDVLSKIIKMIISALKNK